MIEFSKPTLAPVGLQATLRTLGERQSISVRMDEYKRNTVSNAASLAGREIGGKFSVHCDWDNSRYIITRTA